MNTEIFVNKTLIIVLIISVILVLVFGFLGYQYGFKRGLNAKQEIVDKYNNEDPINNTTGNTNSNTSPTGSYVPPAPTISAEALQDIQNRSNNTVAPTEQVPHVPPAPTIN
ncbi:MAG: hypothetical protein CO073_02340 [Candidatus Komeilibacteria bacterium CG_4_9_14_0_8_um_filter_36_9]|uniref:Uncharacterized protein n=1 Tax=Candidatus Komeilibacteria bacterium CG_4_9_14_0_8_um_filter_36_9 TaxID=1974473 RepID=A0A2M8DR85_9BACT|nr:MAG: hypothetical protein CO073_02340 [Candidatus Komeilibacteria bacterium CG_4_9_14_0_8_um_filter_36_9]